MKKTVLYTSLLGILLAGCMTVGPDYSQPILPEADFADVLQPNGTPATDAKGPLTAESLAHWWDNLDDPLLTQLIQDALSDNLDIQQAQSRVRMSRLLLGIAKSPLFPQVDGSTTYTRKRSSENTSPSQSGNALQQKAGAVATGIGVAQTVSGLANSPASALLSVPGQIAGWPVSRSTDLESDFYRAGADASWEIDIFGGTKRSIEAAQADLESVQENLNHIWVSLAGSIAQSYIELRTYQARLAVAESNLEAQMETYELLQSLYDAGLCDELDLQQVRYIVESTRASIPSLRGSVETSLNSLAVLTGKMPGALHESLKDAQPIPTAKLKIVTGIPANALRQRPDIRMAERQLAAQTARIGEATAELYPKLTLVGSIGIESLKSSKLFDSGSDAWSIGPNLSFPIFHAGAIRKNIQVQNELQQQYLAVWENTILLAVKEVRDALVDYAQEQERYGYLDKAVDAAQTALEVAQDQYKNGLTDFNNVLDAQRSLLTFQEQRAISAGLISSNLVRIYKALGGGWRPMTASAENNAATDDAQ